MKTIFEKREKVLAGFKSLIINVNEKERYVTCKIEDSKKLVLVKFENLFVTKNDIAIQAKKIETQFTLIAGEIVEIMQDMGDYDYKVRYLSNKRFGKILNLNNLYKLKK